MWAGWLIVSGICFIIEIYTIGFFIFWFGVGALAALLVSFFTGNLLIQATVFILTSSLLLLLTKPLTKKIVKNTKSTATNVYSIIGKEGLVLESIDSLKNTGTIKVNGEIWSATSDTNIDKDSKIKVTNVDGVKAKVIKI